jgi:hypothetical protein
MQRGAQPIAALTAALSVLALCAASCVDLARPPELLDPLTADTGVGGGPADTPDGPESDPGTTGESDGGAIDAPAATADGPEPDAAVPDAPAADGPPTGDASPAPDGALEAAPIADAALARDTAPDSPVLVVVDNFSDDAIAANAIGGQVASDNQTLAVAAGELSFVWNGNSVFQKFTETLRPRSCPLDIRGYRTLRFRMRASAPDQVIQLFMGRATPSCATATVTGIGSITLTTTMTTYTIDLGATLREDASFFEWSPPLDSAVYFLDDIELHP